MSEPTKERVFNPRTRVRRETVRGFLRGLKALLEQDCVIRKVTLSSALNAEKKQRATTIGKRRKAKSAEGVRTVEQRRQKPGRPRVHRQKKDETDADYRRRLDRQRQQKARAKAKAAKKGSKK